MPVYYSQERKQLPNSKNCKIRHIATETEFSAAASHRTATHIVTDEYGGWSVLVRDDTITGNRAFDKPGWRWAGPQT